MLSRAELAYSGNDFDTTFGLAVQSREGLDNFVSDANTLKETVIQQGNQDFMINIVGSLVGAFAVLGAGVAIWLLLKKKCAISGAHANESSREKLCCELGFG